MIHFTHPLALLLAVPLGAACLRWAAVGGARGVLRVAWLLLLVAIAAGPAVDRFDKGSTLILVIDRSLSMPALAAGYAADLTRRLDAQRGPGDRLAVVGFGRNSVVERYPNASRPPESGLRVDPEETQLYDAVAMALDLVAPTERARLLLLSDGGTPEPLPAALADRLRSSGVPIDFRYVARPGAGDAALNEVRGETERMPGRETVFELQITAPAPARSTLRVYRNGVSIHNQPIELPAGTSRHTWTAPEDGPGLSHYRFEIDVPGDPIPENNRWDTLVRTAGQPAILVLNGTGDDAPAADPVAELLRGAGMAVRVARAEPSLIRLDRLTEFAACVLENVGLDEVTAPGLAALERYVTQWGGGLVVTGGPHSFAAGGYRSTPLDTLLPVELSRTTARRATARTLVVLTDPRRPDQPEAEWESLRTALVALVNELQLSDTFGLVLSEATGAGDVPLRSAADREALRDAAASVTAPRQVPSSLPLALGRAAAMLRQAPAGEKHLLVCVDESLLPDWPQAGADPLRLAPAAASSVTVVSRGAAQPRSLLSGLADSLPGTRFVAAGNAEELPRLLLQDMEVRSQTGFIDEPRTVAVPSGADAVDKPAADAPLGSVPAFHAARLKAGAVARLAAREDPSSPLLARWSRALGRVTAVSFPLIGSEDPDAGIDRVRAFVAQEIRWAARLAGPPLDPRFTARVSGDWATIVWDARDNQLGTLPAGAVVSLVGSDPDTPGKTEPLRADGSGQMARLRLDRPDAYFPVVRSDETLLGRTAPVMRPRPPEFLRPNSGGRAVLSELAQRTGGHPWVDDEQPYDEPVKTTVSLLEPFAWLALAVFLVELADRKFGFTGAIDAAVRTVWGRRPEAPEPAAASEPTGEDVFERAKERSRRRVTRG